DGLVLTYSYTTGNLTKVSYSTSPATSQSYLYEDTNFPNALTGIIDENGNRFATWTYVPGTALTLAASSQHAGGADLTQVAYESIFHHGNATVTYPLGLQEVYMNGSPGSSKIEEIDRLGTTAVRKFRFDSNGYFASRTDWNGNLTTFVNNARGLPKTITEAAGTPLARTTTTAWHPTFHLPAQITEPKRTTAFTYDANGNVLTKKITAGALTRSFAYTYNATGEVLSATDPRGNVTQYTYDAQGNLTSVTDALGHVTNLTSYDGAGRPLTIVDPNGVTTSLTYDPRGRLTSQMVATLKTTYDYDAAGNLIRVTQPDNSFLIYTYDQAHRLTKIKDAVGDHIAYTRDAAGNRIKEQVFDPSNHLTQTHSSAYSALNRLKKTIGAEGQTTSYA
ncbi:MAG: RHS repeat protein, partial [Candidatus Binataceae bacterium]